MVKCESHWKESDWSDLIRIALLRFNGLESWKQVSVSIEEASQQGCTDRQEKEGKRREERKIKKWTCKDAIIARYRCKLRAKVDCQ